MARLTSKGRNALNSSQFAVPAKAPGSGSYPIPDKAHARAALSLEHNAPPSERPAITRKADAMLGHSSPAAPKGSAAAGGSKPRSSSSGTSGQSWGNSGMESAMSAHADKVHPTGKPSSALAKSGY